MTIMFSTIAKTQYMAALFSFLGWLLLGLTGNFGKAGIFSPVKLNSEGMSLLFNNEIHWQPFVGTIIFIAIFSFISIFVFIKYEPKN